MPAEAYKRCPRCGVTKPRAEFYPHKTNAHGLRPRCKSCEAEERKERWAANHEHNLAVSRAWREGNREKARMATKRWRDANRERVKAANRRHHIERKFGLTVEAYEAIIARGCAICGTHEGTICLDHNHANGEIRDALCNRCNTGIGWFSDDPARLRAAAEYLGKHDREVAAWRT